MLLRVVAGVAIVAASRVANPAVADVVLSSGRNLLRKRNVSRSALLVESFGFYTSQNFFRFDPSSSSQAGQTPSRSAVAAGAPVGTGVIIPEGAILGIGVAACTGVGGGLEAAVGVSFFEHPAIRRKPAMPGMNFFGMAKDSKELLPDNYRSVTSV